MCGDATSRDDVMRLLTPLSVPPCQQADIPPNLGGNEGGPEGGPERVNLVLTDPPYGIRSVDRKTGKIGSGGRVYMECIGDTGTDMFREHYRIIRGLSNNLIIWGGQNFTDVLPVTNGWIWWDKCKNCDTLSFGDGELAWSNVMTRNKKYEFRWNGFCRDGNKELNAKVHPNQKPVELHMKILEDFSRPDDVILDCFGGSGTTLIACEMTGRKCLMMEISPEYCGVIAERYGKLKAEFPLLSSGLQ